MHMRKRLTRVASGGASSQMDGIKNEAMASRRMRATTEWGFRKASDIGEEHKFWVDNEYLEKVSNFAYMKFNLNGLGGVSVRRRAWRGWNPSHSNFDSTFTFEIALDEPVEFNGSLIKSALVHGGEAFTVPMREVDDGSGVYKEEWDGGDVVHTVSIGFEWKFSKPRGGGGGVHVNVPGFKYGGWDDYRGVDKSGAWGAFGRLYDKICKSLAVAVDADV